MPVSGWIGVQQCRRIPGSGIWQGCAPLVGQLSVTRWRFSGDLLSCRDKYGSPYAWTGHHGPWLTQSLRLSVAVRLGL